MNFDHDDYDYLVSGYSENWDDDEQDPYEEYEDYVTETGNDYYHLFEEAADVPRIAHLLRIIRRLVARIGLRLIKWRYGWNGTNQDDIPF